MSTTEDIYPSRRGGEDRILERHDPVIFGDGCAPGPNGLDAEQLAFFERCGYVVLEGYLGEWVEPLRREFERLARQMRGAPECFVEPDSEEVRTLFAPHRFSAVFDRFARDPRMLDVVRQILGSEVYIHQSRINVKPGLKGRSFNWHSDFETWHVEDGLPRPRAVTGWIMLTENTPFNGPLFVIPGSHRWYVSCGGQTPEDNYKQSLKRQLAGTPRLDTLKTLFDEGSVAGVFGRPGTVVFHECNIMHGSPDNIAPDPRTNLMYVYNSVANLPEGPYGVPKPRPDFLASRDYDPLEPPN
ncbi:phytanoyl-CoA dioxygenase family protein [Acidihalobacter prosperus]